ncbi:hypothetical protein [Sanguibacter suaedae]|uniref:Uncharacterized protein n=1 Tax=Sanguibacter suaedae TaxID=2795737 RepID=A0A934I3W3_9MICO|nr:hypothetical protein [Sanguibacter suaedae]MBI9115114.1 hypothetical protein [Sanguibacter suaedae]
MTDSDLVEVSQKIGAAFVSAAPDGWRTGEMLFVQVGKTSEFQASARVGDGLSVPFRVAPTTVRAFHKLRTSMAEPGRGAWFTARCQLEAPGKMKLDFDYDNEPEWSTPTSVGHYLEEWERHPRDPEHTPEWLAERLRQAHEWDAQGSR